MKYMNFLSALTLLACSNLLFGASHSETLEKSFEMPDGGEVILENTNGKVEIDAWDKNEVWVEAIKEVRTGSDREAEDLLNAIEIRMELSGNVLRIETKLPRRRGGFWDSLFGNGLDARVSYRLKVPHNIDLDIQTVNGSVTTRQVSGEQYYKSTNGAIRAYEARGSVHAKTTNGSIHAELMEVDDDSDMIFDTTNGSIEVSFPHEFHADLEATTTNGKIKTDFSIQIRGEVSKRRLRGEVNGGGRRVVLHTTNGSIHIMEK